MKIVKPACAGTMESSDAYVEVSPAEELSIEIESAVFERFGEDIRASVSGVLAELGVECAEIRINDRGALDCVIRARVETALRRGSEEAK